METAEILVEEGTELVVVSLEDESSELTLTTIIPSLTISPSFTTIESTVPVKGAGTGAVALSVSNSITV